MKMKELQESWKKWTLMEAEKAVIEDDTGIEEVIGSPRVYLIRSFLFTRLFNAATLINTMRLIWKAIKTVEVDTIDENYFLFKFQSRADSDRVLEGKPWFFNR